MEIDAELLKLLLLLPVQQTEPMLPGAGTVKLDLHLVEPLSEPLDLHGLPGGSAGRRGSVEAWKWCGK